MFAAQWQVLRSGFALDPNQRPESVLALLQAMVVAQGSTAHDAAQSDMAPEQQLEKQALSQSEAAARLRAEQRRQRKEIEEQRRQQARISLQALIARQKQIQEWELAKLQVNSGMSWEVAKRYLVSISQSTGQQVRLPNENEWKSLSHGVSRMKSIKT